MSIPAPPKDKRTKAYKEWKAKYEKENSIGAGDIVEKITTATGIKAAVKFIAGEDCGCEERQESWNEFFRYRLRDCPNEEEFKWMEDFLRRKDNPKTDDEVRLSRLVNKHEQEMICQILNKVLGTKYKPDKCADCVENRKNELRKLYEAYL